MTKQNTYICCTKQILVTLALLTFFPHGSLNAQVRPLPEEAVNRAKATFGPPPGFKELSPKGLIWINPDRHMVVCDGYIALRAGQLEMFACPVGTKEHESIVAIFGQASWIHTGLLAVGAK